MYMCKGSHVCKAKKSDPGSCLAGGPVLVSSGSVLRYDVWLQNHVSARVGVCRTPGQGPGDSSLAGPGACALLLWLPGKPAGRVPSVPSMVSAAVPQSVRLPTTCWKPATSHTSYHRVGCRLWSSALHLPPCLAAALACRPSTAPRRYSFARVLWWTVWTLRKPTHPALPPQKPNLRRPLRSELGPEGARAIPSLGTRRRAIQTLN